MALHQGWWPADFLVIAAAAIAAYTDGIVGGGIVLLMAFALERTLASHPEGAGEWLKRLAIVVAVSIAHHRMRQFQQSERKLRALFASMEDVVLIMSRDGVYLEVMASNPALIYRPSSELTGRRLHDVLPPDLADSFLSSIIRALDERRTVYVDYSLSIEGRNCWFSAAVSPVDSNSVVWVARDITERKGAEEELEHRVRDRTIELSETVAQLHDEVVRREQAELTLRASEERFRLLARATTDAVWDMDVATGFIWRGESYERLFGYLPGQLDPILAAWSELVHPDDRDRIDASYREAIEAGQPAWSDEYRFRRADGSYAYILDTAHIVRDSNKQPVRVLGAMMDVSYRKQLEEQLEQAKRVAGLGRVAASIAHEVNNVLMGIQSNSELVQRNAAQPELRKASENIVQAVRRGKRVTEEILRFTRPTDPALQCVGVRSFLGSWAEEMRPALGDRLTLHIGDVPSDLHMLADPMQIQQVFTNLALNARDATGQRGGTLTIAADVAKSFGAFRFGVVKSADRFVHFIVRDDGRGIARESLPHIFEPLFTTKRDGTGLGLSISYQVLQRHDGQIFVESEAGSGATFHVFIPTTVPELKESEVPAAGASASLRRVLLVEDEPAVASGVAMLLETDGIEVETVGLGCEAVGRIERFLPDAVILDIGLPDIDGVTVYGEIHNRWPKLPVLFASGHGDAAKLESYLARPNVGFILKPFDFDSLSATLARITVPGGDKTHKSLLTVV